ncbi:cytochrome P450 [Mycena latifolia]|nr:cytochrome P450 [Mycena latifolia]
MFHVHNERSAVNAVGSRRPYVEMLSQTFQVAGQLASRLKSDDFNLSGMLLRNMISGSFRVISPMIRVQTKMSLKERCPKFSQMFYQLPKVLAPPLAVYGAELVAEIGFDVVIPLWLAMTAYILSGRNRLMLTVIMQYRDYVVRRDAAAYGAIVCPTIPRSIGGLNLLLANQKDTYPGAWILPWIFLTSERILTADPENFKTILSTEARASRKALSSEELCTRDRCGNIPSSSSSSLLGDGLFAANGDMLSLIHTLIIADVWMEMTRPFFHRERVSDFDTFDLHAEKAMEQITARLREGHPVDIEDVILRYTLDDATSFLIATATAAHPSNVFAEASHETQSASATRNRYGEHWPLTEFWVDKLDAPMKVVRGFLNPILREAVAKKQRGEEEMGDLEVQEGESLLDHLVTCTEDHTIPRDEILNITAAGRDTTAGLITFVTYMLAEHPNVLEKLRNEILRVVGPDRRPTYDDFRELKYLRVQTLRLYLSVILVSQFVMHRRTDLWGPDALTFDPERFLDERLHKYLVPNPFIFLPFNAGTRICLGQQFAYHESSFFVVRLLQTFSTIALAPDAQPPASRPPASWQTEDKVGWKAHEKIRPRSHFTMYIGGGLWVRLGEANAGEGL